MGGAITSQADRDFVGYWKVYAPTAGAIVSSDGTTDPFYVLVDTEGCQIIGVPHGDGDAASVTGPPLAKNKWHKMRFHTITGVTGATGNVYLGWPAKYGG